MLELPTIDRFNIIALKTPPKEPSTHTAKRDIQSLLLTEDKTPLQLADKVWFLSQERKQEGQLHQAQKMMKMQGKDIAKKGAAPGAVVMKKYARRYLYLTF
jgi:hypothetical protein